MDRRVVQKWMLAALFIFMPISVHAQLKNFVVVVKPVLHEKTRQTFLDISNFFSESGYPDTGNWFKSYAEEMGHGTGWVYVDEEGENYIITNRHVVNQAGSVNVYIENPDGTNRSYFNCPILYVDDKMDLAVVQFPGRERLFKAGLQLDTQSQPDLTRVISAGFPGFGVTPLWQIAPGNITNSQARIDNSYDFLIQHSAPIDPGNSGGPLLVEDPTTSIGYRVIGVNTWKAKQREATNFSIPVKYVLTVLKKAKEARFLENDLDARRQALIKECRILAAELGSEHPQYEQINRYISYAFVGEKGWDSYITTLSVSSDEQGWVDYFLDDPVEAMRASIYWLFWYELYQRGDISAIEFQGINYADEQDLANKQQVRTDFKIGQKKTEIIWTREYGHWRVSNLDISLKPGPKPKPENDDGYRRTSIYLSAVYPIGEELIPSAFFTYLLTPRWGFSIGLGYGIDRGDLFVIGGPTYAPVNFVAVQLRAGYYRDEYLLEWAGGPERESYGTYIITGGVLLKLGLLAVDFEIGLVGIPAFLIGAGLGINF